VLDKEAQRIVGLVQFEQLAGVVGVSAHRMQAAANRMIHGQKLQRHM
jgi:N-acetyl-anhydromuramyl-L-alanine amidase AmpD